MVDAGRPYLEEHFGNPSSGHAYGKPVREAMELAREQVAQLVGLIGESGSGAPREGSIPLPATQAESPRKHGWASLKLLNMG